MSSIFAGARRWTVFLLASLVIAAGYAGAAPADKADADKAPRNVLVVNTPAQPVPVTVSNLAATQAVAGTVSVANLPSVQQVSGTVNVASFGIVTTETNVPLITSGGGAFAFSATGAHDEEVWVNVQVDIAKGQVPMAEILVNAASGPVFYYIALTFVRNDVTSGEDFYIGNSTIPFFLPASTGLTLALTRDPTATGVLQGSFSFSGLNLD